MLGFPYSSPSYHPKWGPPTCRANFCEEDYVVTGWIGEFVNTLSNLAYVYYAARGLSRLRHSPNPLHTRMPYYGLGLVGICSAAFHGLLKYHTQMADDLSMLFATATVLHRVFTFATPPPIQRNAAVAMTTFLVMFSIWHAVTDELIGHTLLFGAMIASVAFKTSHILNAECRDQQAEKARLSQLALLGAVSFVTGYGLWHIDFLACTALTRIKRAVGMPCGFFLEMHAWWHILTAVGAYCFMALVEYLTTTKRELRRNERFAWPANMFLDVSAMKGN